MNCRRALRLLDEFVDGELEPRTRARFERHLDGCDACRESLERLRTLTARVGDLPAPRLPDAFLANLAARLARDVPALSRYETAPAGWDLGETQPTAGEGGDLPPRLTMRAA